MAAIKRFGRPVIIALRPNAVVEGIVMGLGIATPGNQIDFTNNPGSARPLPHLSLFQASVHDTDLRGLQHALEKIPAIELQVGGECVEVLYQPNGWCFLETPRTEVLLELQQVVIEATTPFRRGRGKFVWKAAFTRAQAEAYRRFGYPNVGEAWPPHFTFGVVPQGPAEPVRRPVSIAWDARSLVVGRGGLNGTLVEVLFEVPTGL